MLGLVWVSLCLVTKVQQERYFKVILSSVVLKVVHCLNVKGWDQSSLSPCLTKTELHVYDTKKFSFAYVVY